MSMSVRRLRLLLLCGWLATVFNLAGCGKPHVPPEQGKLTIPVAHPVERPVTFTIDFTGRLDAVNSVDIRPRVTGYLVKMPFKEGDMVKKGDLLFEVDPRTYQAQLDRSKSDVVFSEAKLKLAIADYKRAKAIAKTPGAISKQEVDKYLAAEEEAEAAVLAQKAAMEVYRLNRDFCEVTSPIDGQVSRYYFTLGNLVNQDQTTLTTVVSVDPIYCYFDVDERTLERIRNAINKGDLELLKPSSEEIPVRMELVGESNYPHKGYINFVNNKVDPLTGTITVRAVFPNPKPEKGVRLMSPGLFARVQLPLGKPRKALLVPQKAIATDQGIKQLFIVDADNKVQSRRVRVGQQEQDGLQVIEEGITKDDWVVIAGIQMVRPNMEVIPVKMDSPLPATTVAGKDQ